MSFIYTCKCGKQIERTGERQPHVTYFCDPCFNAHMSGDDEEDATQAERAAVVKYIRAEQEACDKMLQKWWTLDYLANDIEKGEHHK